METVVVVCVSFLGALFLASFVALLVLCRHKYCNRRSAEEAEEYRIISPNAISANMDESDAVGELELADIITCDDDTIRELLETEDWAFDAQGLIPHCISVLRLCRSVTEKLVAKTMTTEQIHPVQLEEIVQIAKRVTPRVDDLMRAIQPPLDPKLLEARAAALIFSVSHLALIIKGACRHKGSVEWIDQAMLEMDEHMRILRGVALNSAFETFPQEPDAGTSNTNTDANVTKL
ncbi:transmembrane protein 98-like [Styela clava]